MTSFTHKCYEIRLDIRDYWTSWTNWIYGKIGMCQKCSEYKETRKLDTGQHWCFPCIVNFNQHGVFTQRHTFICLICGCHYYQYVENETYPAMLYCQVCCEIDAMLMNQENRPELWKNETVGV